MKTLVIALAMVAGASGAALADSSALDVMPFQPVNASALDYTATTSIGASDKNQYEVRARLGDGSPSYVGGGNSALDYTATASIGDGSTNQYEVRARLGDGSPTYISR